MRGHVVGVIILFFTVPAASLKLSNDDVYVSSQWRADGEEETKKRKKQLTKKERRIERDAEEDDVFKRQLVGRCGAAESAKEDRRGSLSALDDVVPRNIVEKEGRTEGRKRQAEKGCRGKCWLASRGGA